MIFALAEELREILKKDLLKDFSLQWLVTTPLYVGKFLT